MSDQNLLKSKKEQVHELRQKGYVIVKGLVSKERCDAMRAVARQQLAEAAAPVEFEADLKYPGAPDSKDAPGGHTVRRLLDAYVRHPLYGAAILFFIGLPLILGSWWGLWAAPVASAILAVRAVFEERELAAGLDGYPAYMQAVPYRLVPYVW